MSILSSEDAIPFLSGMWDVLDNELDPASRLEDHTLHVEMFELPAGIWVAIVSLPSPSHVGEAFHVACAARLERVDDTHDPFSRAFTLDLAGWLGTRPVAIIREWDEDGEQQLDVPELESTSATAFVDALEALFALDPAPPSGRSSPAP